MKCPSKLKLLLLINIYLNAESRTNPIVTLKVMTN